MIESGSFQAVVTTEDFSKSIMNEEGAGHKTENEMVQYGNDYHENSSLSDNSASQLSSNLGKLGKENVVYDANIGTEITKVDMLEEFESDGTTKRKTVKETTMGEANSNDNEESQDEQQKSEVIAIAKNESNLENEEKSIVNKQNRISPNHHFKQPKPPKNGRSSENAFPRIVNSRLQNQGTYPRTKSTTQSSKGTVLISKKGNEAQNDSAEIQSPASKGSLHRRVSIGTVRQNCTIPRPFSLATDKRASLGVRHSGGEIAGVESKRSIMNNAMSPLAERRQSATKSASAVSETKHLHHVGHKIPSTGASKGRPSSGTSASVSNNEGANNKKESNSELVEKVHAKEGRKHFPAKMKEQPEGQLEKVTKSQSFKATPMPNFYQAAAPPKPELKKIPPTRPKSPKLGRRNSSIGLDSDGNPSQSQISARLSLGHNNIERHLQKPRQDNASKTPSKAKSAVNMTMQSSSTTRRDKSVESKYNGSRIPVTPRKRASNIPETGYPSESIENDQIPTSKPVNDFSESSINEEKIMPQEADGVEENNAPKPKCVRDCFDSSTNEEKVTLQETDALE